MILIHLFFYENEKGKCLKVLTKREFIARANKIHGNKYDYENNSTTVCIICKAHGQFWQRPNNHLDKQQGCPTC